MVSPHKIDELVKAYLLGTLETHRAAEIERRYFLEREYLQQVSESEILLIEDYIEKRLAGRERKLFEEKYLANPDLARKVAEVRNRLGRSAPADRRFRPFVWRLSLAAVAVCLLVAGGSVYRSLSESLRPQQTLLARLGRNPAATVMVRLSPGLAKGAGPQPNVIPLPDESATVRFSLELPGRGGGADYQVRLERVEPDGGRRTLWNSVNLRAVSEPGGSVLTAEVSGALLRGGQYQIVAALPRGDVVESYFLMVSAREPAR